MLNTAVQIILSVLIVIGLYFAFNALFFTIVFGKDVRLSIKLTVNYDENDCEDKRIIKRLCAKTIAKELGLDQKINYTVNKK